MDTLLAWLIGTGAAAALVGAGHVLLRVLWLPPMRAGAVLAISMALGAGLYSYLFFGLSLGGVVRAGPYWLIWVIGIAISLPQIRQIVARFREGRSAAPDPMPRWFRRFLLTVITISVVLSFVASAAPVSDWDSRCYHIGAAKRYIQEGRMTFHPDDVAHCLFLGQTPLSLWLMTLGNDSAAQVLTFWFAIGLLGATHALACRLFSSSAALMAVALVAGFAFFAERGIQPSPDVAATMMAVLPVFLLLELRGDIRWNGVAAIAIIAGTSVVFRMNNAVYLAVVALFAVVWWRGYCGMSWARLLSLAVLGVVICLALMAPWTARNYAWTGNPVYPFMSEHFPGWQWNEATSRHIHRQWVVTQSDAGPSALAAVTKQILESYRFGSLCWSLAPLAILARRGRRETALVLGLWLLSVMVIARFALLDRYFSSAMPLGAALASHAVVTMLGWERRFRMVLLGLTSIIMAGDLALAAVFHRQFCAAALGLRSRDAFLASTTGLYNDFVWMNRNLPPDAKVLVIFREEYYLKRPAMHFAAGFTPHIGLFDFEEYRDVDEFAEALRRHGFTHYFFASPEGGAMYWDVQAMGEKGRRLFTELWQRRATLIRHNDRAIIGGRLYNVGQTETWVYRLSPPS